MPKISIIMPSYNDAKYISFAINSVLSQTFADWELIVIDDGSMDNSAEIAQEFADNDPRIQVIRQKNQGVVTARNNAIRVARGQYILPLDADDRLAHKCLEILYDTILSTDASVVAPGFAYIGARTDISFHLPPTRRNMCISNRIVNSSLFRKSDWAKYGGYSLDFSEGIEDYAFWINFIKDGKKIIRVPNILFFYRIKPPRESRNAAAMTKANQLKRKLAQRFPIMRFHVWRHKIIRLKKVSHVYILRLFKIPVFVLPRLRPKHYIKLNFFTLNTNFGDMLNIPIARDLFGKDVREASVKKSEAVFIGSLMDTYITNKKLSVKWIWRKYIHKPVKVWGSGFIKCHDDEKNHLLRKMDVYALRGHLSQHYMQKYTGQSLDHIVLGDPGLLAGRLHNTRHIPKKYDVGIIPHYVDKNNSLLKKIKIPNAVIIDVSSPIDDFLDMVASCRTILSSAMHGLIAADSLGIPNARLIVSDKIVGGDFKFNDYYSVFGMDDHMKIDLNKIDTFTDWQSIIKQYKITSDQVNKICDDLIKVFPYKAGKNEDFCRSADF